MKIKLEMDISPEELLELFAGNQELLQQAMLKLFKQSMPQSAASEANVLEFWQSMAKRSQEMFDQYQKDFNGSK